MSESKYKEESPAAPFTAPNLEVGPLNEFETFGDSVRSEALALRQFAAYAGPLTWGPWVQIASHGGVVSYDISYEAVGSTIVHCTVNYFSGSGWRKDLFRDSIRITTGNAWAVVHVSFYGNPFGSAVNGRINP